MRGILREFGYTIPQGSLMFVARASAELGDASLPADLNQELGRVIEEITAFLADCPPSGVTKRHPSGLPLMQP